MSTFLNYSYGRDMRLTPGEQLTRPYFVTAEYTDGYKVIARFKTLAAAKRRVAELEIRQIKREVDEAKERQ
jgi:hypothetical protein